MVRIGTPEVIKGGKFWYALVDPDAYKVHCFCFVLTWNEFIKTLINFFYFKDVMEIGDIYQYYLGFAKDYEAIMKSWGYCMPEITADAIVKKGEFDDVGTVNVLDLGCGDGLVGHALKKRGFK